MVGGGVRDEVDGSEGPFAEIEDRLVDELNVVGYRHAEVERMTNETATIRSTRKDD